MTNARYKTHRGKEFNMAAFADQNGDTRAVSNVPMNGRGDIIDARGNVRIPSQTISRATSNIKNNESQRVSLKADDNLSPVKHNPVETDFASSVVATKTIDTPTGPATEVEYADGSIEVININKQEEK
jgi:hypothetical protein